MIQGNADLICETELDKEQRLYAEYISSSSEQMQLYIRTLIDISRAATGYQLYMEDIDLPAYIKQLREQIDALCQTKKIGLQVEIEHLPAVLSMDKLLLERAIMNVVNNALDYSPQDSSILISMTGDKGSLQISVTDAGPGFSQEDLLHAEEQFYMADRSRSSNLHFGMGLFYYKIHCPTAWRSAYFEQFRKNWRRTGHNLNSILTSRAGQIRPFFKSL